MKPLLQRELEIIAWSPKKLKLYVFISIGLLIAAWLVGPNVLRWIEAEQLSLYLTITIFVIMNGKVSTSLEEDVRHSQKVFLQTLPIKTERIVHTKFISILLLNIYAFIWAFSLCVVNILMNHGEWAHLSITFTLSSLLLFISSMMVAYFFLFKYERLTIVFFVSLVIWLIFDFTGFYLVSLFGFSFELYTVVAMLLSLIIYGVVWLVVIISIKTRGIPLAKK